MGKKTKKKKWIRLRHKIVRNVAYWIIYPYCKIKYGVTIDAIKDTRKRAYLILMNHQTGFDQFFLGMAFPGTVYYIASEDLFSNGFISKMLTYLVAPIPIKKQTTDVHAILNCMRVAREGGTIALAPEGNRTFGGENVHMNPAIAKLVKKLGLPLVFYRIEGGYGVHPRWSDVVRRGKMHCYVSRIMEPEEYSPLSDRELNEIIKTELYVNEGCLSGEFRHKKTAEYLERAMYVCPWCGLSEFESHNDTIECKKCHRKVQYLYTKELKGVNCDFPYTFTTQWYNAQCDFVNNLDTTEYTDKPLYEDTSTLSEVILYKKKVPIDKNVHLSLFGDRLEIKGTKGFDLTVNFDDPSCAITILGKNKLNIYHSGKVYQLKSGKRFNALKYLNIYHRHKNIMEGKHELQFLGL